METIKRKLEHILQYLEDLKAYQGCTREEFMQDHYTVERIIELLVVATTDVLLHILAERNEPTPSSYRQAFLTAGTLGIISSDLAQNLARAVGMRNILVHRYDDIDYDKVYEGIDVALSDFSRFLTEIQCYLDTQDQEGHE